ncbi:MAG TPA: hypothetical protein VL651_06590 [Bacteroidia bacterium]|jgi:hypothetical protein|nr:hypothetical protein [Bacteroidia bacterium]
MKIRLAALLPLFMLASCGNDAPVATGNDSTPVDTLTATKVDAPESTSDLPSPLRVAAMFKRSGLKYLPGLTNSDANASKYSSTFTSAENMGVYSADMAYCVSNKQSNEGTKYLKVIRDLGKQLNLNKVFEQSNLYDRFQNNLNNEDSLGKVVAEIQYQTDQQLEENGQNDIYGIIFAGAWVESMYIGGEVYQKDGNDNVLNALLEQMAVCKNIVSELEVYQSQNTAIAPLIADLKQIQEAINAMPSMKKLNDDPDLEFSDVHPTKEEILPVIKKIEEIRTKIING